MEENKKQKCKRRRVNPSHRWKDYETNQLIEAVADATKDRPESFEKPTAERFYTKIKTMAPTLERIEWVSLKSKMRYLKGSYVSAVDWKNKTGAGLLASGDETSVTAYIQKICPNFNSLADIFGQRKNVSPQLVFDSQIDTCMPNDHSYTVSYTMPVESEQDSIFEPPARSQTSTPECEILLSSFEVTQENSNKRTYTTNNFNGQPSTSEHARPRSSFHLTQRKNQQKKMSSGNSINDLLLIQEKRLDLEVQKLELEKEREKNKIELKALELKHQIELRKIELEMQKEEKLQIEKLKLESEERLRKYEIDSKVQRTI